MVRGAQSRAGQCFRYASREAAAKKKGKAWLKWVLGKVQYKLVVTEVGTIIKRKLLQV